MLSSEGPAHKPSFRFKLGFKLVVMRDRDHHHHPDVFKFEGEGTNKKLAKYNACLKALFFLNSLTGFFSMFDSIYIANLIKYEMKMFYNKTDSLDEFFLKALGQSQKYFI
jgi:hypothetical protein